MAGEDLCGRGGGSSITTGAGKGRGRGRLKGTKGEE